MSGPPSARRRQDVVPTWLLVTMVAAFLVVVDLRWRAGQTAGPRGLAAALERAVDDVARPSPPEPSPPRPAVAEPFPLTQPSGATDLALLRRRQLLVPVRGVSREDLRDSFDDPRGGGDREHLALDIMAPRNTPIVAVDDGTVARLLDSDLGGLTVYQLDPERRFSYYYAHLERYAPGLEPGAELRRGQPVGFVGSSGNAPDHAPHLHFAIYRLTADARWWDGEPINPYAVLVTP